MNNTTEKWNVGVTPTVGTTEASQRALDWWRSLPVQDLYGDSGWGNLCIKYHQGKTDCYHFTEDEVLYMYEQEHK